LHWLDADQSTLIAASAILDVEPEFLDEIISPDRIIDGSIRIRSGSCLHVDLNYFKDLPAENKILRSNEELLIGALDKTVIKLKETRKIKFNEIHYFRSPDV
jgi:hypothetical protein